MPTRITKRGMPRFKGVVRIDGRIVKEKLFPDDSNDSYKNAVAWETRTRDQILTKEAKTETLTGSWAIIDWATKYLAYSERTHAHRTFKEKRAAFERFLQSGLFNPEDRVEKITRSVVNQFLMKEEENRPGGGVNNDRKDLGAGWSYGIKYLEGFPADRLNPFHQVPERPESTKPRYVPPVADFWKVHTCAEGQDKVMLISYLCLAARRSELFRLKVSDLDFNGRQVQLWTRKRKSGCLEPDWVPMVDMLAKALRGWLKARPIDSDYVFICMDPRECNSERYGEPFKKRIHLMKRLCRRAGIKPFGFHGIRHLTASILYDGGVEINVIQQILRHLSPTTTAKYLHRLRGSRQAREALETSLKAPDPMIPNPPSPGGQLIPFRPKNENPAKMGQHPDGDKNEGQSTNVLPTGRVSAKVSAEPQIS